MLFLVLCLVSTICCCKVSIIGAGVGGLHTAFRLVNSSAYLPSEICVFEATNRVGGRAHSVRGVTPIPDSIDIGAHGYKPIQHKIMDSIVNVVLNLTTSCRSRKQTKETCYDIGDSYFFLRNKYLKDIMTSSGSLPYNIRWDDKRNSNGGEPNPVVEAVNMYPFILESYHDLVSLDPAVRYPAAKQVLEQVRNYKINGKYPTQYTLRTLLDHSEEYWALYLDGDGEAISSVLNVNVYDVLREAIYYALVEDENQPVPLSGGFVITNNQDVEIGYATVSERLADLLVNLGVNVQLNKKLVSIYNTSGSLNLRFGDGSVINTQNVILNIAPEQLNQLSRDSVIFTQESERLFGLINTVCAVKGYLYYPIAWWEQYGDSSISTTEINKYYEFKDSNIRCNGEICHGVTQVIYADGADYCTSFWSNPINPPDTSGGSLVIINSTETDPIRSKLFADIVASTKHVSINALKMSVDPVDPTVLVLGAWKGGWHTIKPNNYLGGDVQTMLLKPVPTQNIFLVNEAYSPDQGWAEGSLIASEKVLRKYFNLNRPIWMGNNYWYDTIIANDHF